MVQDLFDVASVECREGHLLHLRFDDGAEGVFDMSPWMCRKPYLALKSPAIFNGAKVAFGTVVWPGGIDIDPETLRNGIGRFAYNLAPDQVSTALSVAEDGPEYGAKTVT